MTQTSKLTDRMQNKKAVFLDLDNTLYAYGPCHQYALKQCHLFYKKNFGPLSLQRFKAIYGQARKTVHKRLPGQAASHSRLLYFQILLETQTGQVQPRFTLAFEKCYWNAFLKRMKLASWVIPFLKWCRRNKKKCVIVTNLTTQIQLHKLRKLGISRWIDFLVSSEEAGIEKPHPRIFRLALRKAGCRPKEVLLIGDDRKQDASSLLECLVL